MHNISPITKTAFLEAFKTCDKYLKCRYIEQEAFFNNMVYAMLVARQNLPGNIYLAPEFFDDVSFRKDVIDTVKKLGLTYWRKYKIYSEEMRAEARSHYLAAGTDAAGIAISAGIGKAVKHFPALKRSISFNTKNTVWGKSVDINLKESLKKGFKNGVKISNTDTVVEFAINPVEIGANFASGVLTEDFHRDVAPGKSFSFGGINDSLLWKAGDVVTDFVPYVGNAKAAVSSVVNYKIGDAYFETAKIAEENEQKSMDADSKFIQTHLFVNIEKDLNAIDKTTLYQMWLYAAKQSNIK